MERPRHPVNVLRPSAAALAMLLALGGCSYIPPMPPLPGLDAFDAPRILRGQKVDEEELRQVTVGVSTRTDVEALLGSPTATSTFNDNEWYYISSVTRQRPGRALAVSDQQVVIVRFDGRGTVTEVRRQGEEQMRDVRMVSRETPSPGTERTILQELFGNLGRLGPGIGAGQTPTAPGAPSPTTNR